MIIINCLGGLGNQMFQYAFYRALELSGVEVKLDISGFDSYKLHNGFELTRIFAIKPVYASKLEADRFLHLNLFFHIIKKLRIYSQHIVQKDFRFNKKYLKTHGNYYLDGYWQSEKYFANYTKQIKQEFAFPPLDNKNLQYADLMRNSTSVAIHVRRGDYVNHHIHGDICTKEYYNVAISLIKSKTLNPLFFIFSDDIEWCKANLRIDNAIYVVGNHGANNYKDMQLMSVCKYNIIANSSFSWWAAWLNQNATKIIIAPRKWFNDPALNTRDLLPTSWIQI